MAKITARRRRLGGRVSVILVTVAAIATVPWLATGAVAEDPVPPGKQALMDTPPAAPSVPDGDVDPVRAARADSGNAGSIREIKRTLPNLLQRFNHAQQLPPDQATRETESKQLLDDVTYASSGGADGYVQGARDGAGGGPNGREASQFRKDMVAALDKSVVVPISQGVAGQMYFDARNINMPSLTDSAFTVVEWQGVQVVGGDATAQFIATYSNCFGGGKVGNCVDQLDSASKQWYVTMRLGDDGFWRMVTFEAQTFSRDGQ